MHRLVVLCLVALTALTASAQSPVPASTRQLVVVTTADWPATDGVLQRYARSDDGWTPVGPEVNVVVGRSGLGWGRGLHGGPPHGASPVKAEGDGRAPAGAFRLSAAFGYAEAEATGLPYVQATPGVECVDDRRSAYYNRVLDRAETGEAVDWQSHEEMRRTDGLYRIGVIVAHNGRGVDPAVLPTSSLTASGAPASEPVAGGGSCIFLHVWRGPGTSTSGCTAMPDPALQGVLAWLDAEADPVLVQLPEAEADRLREPWGLPSP